MSSADPTDGPIHAVLDANVRPIAGAVGATVSGLDLRRELSAETIDAIEDLLAARGVVIFLDQSITPAEHHRFGARFGALREPPHYVNTMAGDGLPEIGVLTSED